ncbi:MAG: YgjV family protein [Clostridiales bacterium]|nr:YgjV family protein [Clostridiales bacterium]
MSMKDIFVQAIGIFGTILFFLSYQCKSNKSLFRVQFISYLCYTIHLLMLGAITGGISYILNTARSFCLGSKNTFLKGKTMCWIICVLQLVTLMFTWDGWWSILPVAANIASTIGGYTYNARKIRAAGMFINSPLWIAYDIAVGSWAGVLDEVVSEASMIISVWRYGWKNLDSVEE